MTALDEDYLEQWAREQQRGSAPGRYTPRCTACGHSFHGLRCAALVNTSGHLSTPCECPSAPTADAA